MPVQDTNFFKNNDLHAYQKNENTYQAILPLIENMNEVMTSGKCWIVIMVDLGPFDSVLRDGAIYKLYKAGITNKLLPVLASFLKHRQYRNLVNTHTGDWSNKISGAPQGLILCPLIFLVCTADMSVVDETRKEHELNESEYADDFNIWRTHKNCFTLLANIQLLAFINLQMWYSKWQILLNISKAYYMIFYDKKKLPPVPDIQATTDETPITRVKEKRIHGIVTDEQLSFKPHVELPIKKCRSAHTRLTFYPDFAPNVALQLYKTYIKSRLEYGCIIWGYKIHQKDNMNKLVSA